MLPGKAIFATSSSIRLVAAPSDSPAARLTEIVATGNCPRWLTATGVECVSMCAKLLRGMICSREPESVGTGCVVPGFVGVEEIDEAAPPPDVELSDACAAEAPTAGVPVPPVDEDVAPPGDA